jgi:hypothetical protein
MRFSIALTAMAGGLTLGYAALANAAAPGAAAPAPAGPPPAAPIFYCPTPGAAAPAATPARARGAGHARLHHVRYHARPACPMMRREAHERHHWRMGPPEPMMAMGPPPPAPMGPPRMGPPPHMGPPPGYMERDGDVSASQAFIYRYERALHGLNARAAEQAWGHGDHDWDHDRDRDRDHEAMRGPPPVHEEMRHGEEEGRRVAPDGHMWAHEEHGDMDHHDMDHGRMDMEHMDRDHMDMDRDHMDRDHMAHDQMAQGGEHVIIRRFDHDHPDMDDGHGDHEHHAYAWRGQVAPGEVAGGAYSYDRSVSERSGGWSYSERDGQGHVEHWGDADRGDHLMADRERAERERAEHDVRRGPCPPSPEHGCAYASGGAQWQDGSYGAVYEVSGRDAHGYLVWPGKTPEGETVR